jgi:hypothetical protein
LAHHAVVNDLNLKDYELDVMAQYQRAMDLVGQAKQAESDVSQSQNSIDVKGIRCQIDRLYNVCVSLDKSLAEEKFDNISVSCDLEDVESCTDKLLTCLSLLSHVSKSDENDAIEKSISDAIMEADNVKRKASKKLKYAERSQVSDLFKIKSDQTQQTLSSSQQSSQSMPSSTGLTDNVKIDSVSRPKVDGMTSPSVVSPSNLVSNSNQYSMSPSGVTYSSPSNFDTLPVSSYEYLAGYRPTSYSQAAPSNSPFAQSSDVHLRKTSLPTFSGERKDWPEFKAIWRELAESVYRNPTTLAYELKRSLKGSALDKVKHIYVTKPDAYTMIWQRLCDYYDDVTACVQAALEGLNTLKSVRDDDYRALVQLIDTVEDTCAQLEQLGQLHVLSVREVDRISDFLPSTIRSVWNRMFHQLILSEKLCPFPCFLRFLIGERAAVSRLAENQKKTSHSQKSTVHAAQGNGKRSVTCAIHLSSGHKLSDCKEFKAMNLDDKFEMLRDSHLCFRCFEPHRRDKCKERSKCEHCGRTNHHAFLCRKLEPGPQKSAMNTSSNMVSGTDEASTANSVTHSSNVVRSPGIVSLYAIQQAYTSNAKKITVFCDNGSNSTYITHRAAEKVKASKLERFSLEVTTMGNRNKTYDTWLYEVPLRTITGKTVNVQAFGMEEITGPVSKIDVECLRDIFTRRAYSNLEALQRQSSTVDLLLGCDYFGLHPKWEICSAGHLSIMQGELGVCLQGSHPSLKEETSYSLNMVRALHNRKLYYDCNHSRLSQNHPEFTHPSLSTGNAEVSTVCMLSKVKVQQFDFLRGEELAIETVPKCGACKCGKCPSVGHTYSFREEQELKLIRSNLTYDDKNECWLTKYPWIIDPAQLPDNYSTALATLKSMEYTLSKDENWAQLYSEQIQDMLQRNVARKLSPEEVSSGLGLYFTFVI